MVAWQPRWRGKREMPDRVGRLDLEHGSGCAPDSLEDVLFFLGAVVVVVLFFVFVWPLLLVIVELVLLALLVLLGVVARVVLRRPWIVEATPASGPGRFRWKVVGLRRSGEVVDEVAAQLSAGIRSIQVPDAEPC